MLHNVICLEHNVYRLDQGYILATFLALRLKHFSNQGSVRLYTDDCVQYRNIHSLQDCLILHEDLTSLGQWKADWNNEI